MRRYGRFIAIALVVGVALPLVGCPLVVLKLCLINNSSLPIVEVNLSAATNPAWGANQLVATLAAGATTCLEGISPNTYDVRAIFESKVKSQKLLTEVVTFGVPLTNANRNITYTGMIAAALQHSVSAGYLKGEGL
jgi:hypothetical protein